MFSKACEYGIRAVIYIAVQSLEGRRVSLKDIAREIASPEAFTAKILQQLSRNNIIDSVKGPTGGFEIRPEKMEKIRLMQVVVALDGDRVFKGCGLGLTECSEKFPCPVHFKFKKIREGLLSLLENTNIRELALGLKDGITFLRV